MGSPVMTSRPGRSPALHHGFPFPEVGIQKSTANIAGRQTDVNRQFYLSLHRGETIFFRPLGFSGKMCYTKNLYLRPARIARL